MQKSQQSQNLCSHQHLQLSQTFKFELVCIIKNEFNRSKLSIRVRMFSPRLSLCINIESYVGEPNLYCAVLTKGRVVFNASLYSMLIIIVYQTLKTNEYYLIVDSVRLVLPISLQNETSLSLIQSHYHTNRFKQYSDVVFLAEHYRLFHENSSHMNKVVSNLLLVSLSI